MDQINTLSLHPVSPFPSVSLPSLHSFSQPLGLIILNLVTSILPKLEILITLASLKMTKSPCRRESLGDNSVLGRLLYPDLLFDEGRDIGIGDTTLGGLTLKFIHPVLTLNLVN